jgi:hypothetical protein
VKRRGEGTCGTKEMKEWGQKEDKERKTIEEKQKEEEKKKII